MISTEQVRKYLERIGLSGPVEPVLPVLKKLQKFHLLAVPFENLDIHYDVPITLDVNRIYKKIVEETRGGFCYEINGLFHSLLSSLGYRVKIISARVYSAGTGNYSPPYDHLAIMAQIDTDEYLVDAGFGAFSLEPLKIEPGVIQQDPHGVFLIRQIEDESYIVSRQTDDKWIDQYMFSAKEEPFEAFSEMCAFNQTSPRSHFRKNKISSIATEKGRITVLPDRVKITNGDVVTEIPITGEAEYLSALYHYCKIKPPLKIDS